MNTNARQCFQMISLSNQLLHSLYFSTCFVTAINIYGNDAPSIEFNIYIYQRCQLVRFTRKPYGFLRFARAYGRTMQSLRIFKIIADSNLQSFHTLYSNCCQFAVTPAMLREHERK